MAYKISNACQNIKGCERICMRVCPTGAIKDDFRKSPTIDEKLCIDCGVCGSYCPFNGIYDQYGRQVYKLEQAHRPVAKVIEELCTGCRNCVDVCPFGCLEMTTSQHNNYFLVAKNIRPKDCVACRLCVEVCSDKRAIRIYWPNGREAINWDVTETDPIPIKLSGSLFTYS
ncbi:MAG: 4Fe-4S binding protein [Planctomycetota bacterium]